MTAVFSNVSGIIDYTVVVGNVTKVGSHPKYEFISLSADRRQVDSSSCC